MIELHRFPVFPFPPPGCRTRCAMVVALALLVLAPALPHSRQWPTGRSSRATCSCSSSRAAHLPSPNKEEITPTAGLSVGVPHRHPSHFPGNRACSSQSLRTRGLKNRRYAFAVLEGNARFERRYPLLFISCKLYFIH